VATSNENKKAIYSIFWIWLVITIVGVLISIKAPAWLMPTSASSSMHLVIETIVVFSVAAAPVAALVYAITLYALVKWRWRGDGVPPDGPNLRNNSTLTSVWIVSSTMLTIFLLIWGLAALAVDEGGGNGKNPMTVNVTGQQWAWSFTYPGTHVASNELYLPVNDKITFNVTSKDVVHGFWIVQMGVKVNANPGVSTSVSVTPNKIGTYDIRCTEICGLYHAYMVTRVHVLSDTAFAKWLSSQPSRA